MMISCSIWSAHSRGRKATAYAEAIRRRYAVALIDEFQDTDPVQYRIFRQIYHGTTAPVFFVGDPKQAIYSFRGADVFAYLHACRRLWIVCYTLEINWRSDPGLIQAVNTLFASARHPFCSTTSSFARCNPPQRSEAFTEHGQQVAELRLWFLESEEDGTTGHQAGRRDPGRAGHSRRNRPTADPGSTR